ncbi:hypothetical protein HDV00_003318 [Rhizophlyctis rosea]|nr:hypothetical protein HDV00_003318 [Rhizophlyctis rosea]
MVKRGKLWVTLGDRNPVKVEIFDSDDIDDLRNAVLKKFFVDLKDAQVADVYLMYTRLDKIFPDPNMVETRSDTKIQDMMKIVYGDDFVWTPILNPRDGDEFVIHYDAEPDSPTDIKRSPSSEPVPSGSRSPSSSPGTQGDAAGSSTARKRSSTSSTQSGTAKRQRSFRLEEDGTPGSGKKPKKRYICEECDGDFSTSGHLARHRRIHTGVKPYVCLLEGCNKQFSRLDNMMQHYRSHMLKRQDSVGPSAIRDRESTSRSGSTTPPAERQPTPPSTAGRPDQPQLGIKLPSGMTPSPAGHPIPHGHPLAGFVPQVQVKLAYNGTGNGNAIDGTAVVNGGGEHAGVNGVGGNGGASSSSLLENGARMLKDFPPPPALFQHQGLPLPLPLPLPVSTLGTLPLKALTEAAAAGNAHHLPTPMGTPVPPNGGLPDGTAGTLSSLPPAPPSLPAGLTSLPLPGRGGLVGNMESLVNVALGGVGLGIVPGLVGKNVPAPAAPVPEGPRVVELERKVEEVVVPKPVEQAGGAAPGSGVPTA